jgi:hypothetical protein
MAGLGRGRSLPGLASSRMDEAADGIFMAVFFLVPAAFGAAHLNLLET